MGKLFDLLNAIDKVSAEKNMDRFQIRSKIGMKAGFVLSFINASTEDDGGKIEKLKEAAKDVLGVVLK